jgi:hypothetical protein
MYKGQMKKAEFMGWFFFALFAFLVSGISTARAADNAACLQCHQNAGLSKGKKDGSPLSLYVEEAAFKASVHGAAGMGCVDCHQEAKPNVHPAEGFKEVGCASCHGDSAEAYRKTAHGAALAAGLNAPNCQDCHTSHYVRKISDPQSPVQASRISNACGQCHNNANPPKDFFTALATYRITGHRKVNPGDEYTTRVCANCHAENSGHPTKRQPGASCYQCHNRSSANALLLGPMHVKISLKDQPVTFLLRILYGAGLLFVVVVAAAFFSFTAYRRKKSKKASAAPGGGQSDQQSS